MLEVHPPHEAVHGWKDFLVHLLTITVGLLIALSLEGCVEWQHRRHLVHEAESSLHKEIKDNAENLQGALDDVHKEQAFITQDIAVMKKIIANPKITSHDDLTINFRIRTFKSVSWKTAQSTGALSYMPYERAQDYSDIYTAQEELDTAEHQAVRDTVVSIGPFLGSKAGDPNPSGEEALKIKDRLETLGSQLTFLEAMILGLDTEYKKFLSAHSE
jgi:hypothetical protein